MSDEDACVLTIEKNYSDSEFLLCDSDTDNESEIDPEIDHGIEDKTEDTAAGCSGVYDLDSDSEEGDIPRLRYKRKKRNTDGPDQEQANDSDGSTENSNSTSTDKEGGENSDHAEIVNSQQVSDSEDLCHMDIKTITQIFRKKLKTYSISQRMAAKYILKCSQSTVSELYAKADRHGTSKDLSARGREPYEKMEEWLASETLQKETRTAVAQQRAYGARNPAKPRSKSKKAVKFSPVQFAVLVKLYQKDSRPPAKKTELIAETLSLEVSEIRTWYNNQRARNFPAGREQSSCKNIPDDLDIFVNNF